MRLTLRTLLAYMDDRLPPAGAREIGLKISKSAFAAELLERIREVKRRRRVAAAAAETPSIDANLLAEYLDDQLSPELVQRIEQKILASDQLLAEVAAAHELLGLLHDPIDLEPSLRDRLYGLDPSGVEDVIRATGGTTTSGSAAPTTAWQPDLAPANSRKNWSAIVIAGLALIWVISLAIDPLLFQSRQLTSNAANVQPAAGAAVQPQPEATVEPAQVNPAAQQPSDEVEVAAAVSSVESPAALPAVTDAAPKNTAPAAMADANAALSADAPSAPDRTPTEKPAAMPAAELPPELPAVAREAIYLQADSRAVLVADAQTNQWISLSQIQGGNDVLAAPNTTNTRPLLGNNYFGIPGSFEMRIRGGGSRWLARTNGPGLFRLPPAGEVIEILAGRLLVSADPAQQWPEDGAAEFRADIATLPFTVTLQSPESRVAIEVEPGTAVETSEPQVAESFNLPTSADQNVRIVVVEGSARVEVQDRLRAVVLNSADAVNIQLLGGRDWGRSELSKIATGAIPPWMLSTETNPTPEAAAIQKRVLDSLTVPGVPGELVQPLLTDRNPQVGLAAADVLGLTADTSLLLSALFEGLDESVHRRLIDGLRAAVRSSSSARIAVAASLETRLSMTDAEFVMQLISGINETQARDRLLTSQLMLYLQSDSLTLRTLAIGEMERLTGNRQNFFPNADASRRRDAVNRWQKVIDRNGGTLLP